MYVVTPPPQLGTQHGCLLATSGQHRTGGPGGPSQYNTVRKTNEKVGLKRKKEMCDDFQDDVIVYTEDAKESTDKLLELTNEFSKGTRYGEYANSILF